MLVYTLTRQLVSICRFYANMFGVKNHPSSMPKLYANCLFQLAYLGTLLCADFGRQHLLAYNGSILWCRYWYANTVRVRDRHSSVPFSTPTQFAYGCQQMCAIQYANTVRVRMPYWGVPFCTPTQFAYGCLQACAIQYANTVRVWMPTDVCHSVRQHSSRMDAYRSVPFSTPTQFAYECVTVVCHFVRKNCKRYEIQTKNITGRILFFLRKS